MLLSECICRWCCELLLRFRLFAVLNSCWCEFLSLLYTLLRLFLSHFLSLTLCNNFCVFRLFFRLFCLVLKFRFFVNLGFWLGRRFQIFCFFYGVVLLNYALFNLLRLDWFSFFQFLRLLLRLIILFLCLLKRIITGFLSFRWRGIIFGWLA